MQCTKISAEFEFTGHSPRGAHPQNVALGYDVGKINTGCLVCTQLLFQCVFVYGAEKWNYCYRAVSWRHGCCMPRSV